MATEISLDQFIPHKTFVARFTGRKAALHYLHTVFLPHAKNTAAHGGFMVEVYRCEDFDSNEGNAMVAQKKIHIALLRDLLEEVGWKTQTNMVTDASGRAALLWAFLANGQAA